MKQRRLTMWNYKPVIINNYIILNNIVDTLARKKVRIISIIFPKRAWE